MSWLREVFSESIPGQPSGSVSRVITFMFAVASVIWISYIVHATKAFPSLWDVAMFVSSPYLVNQGKAMVAEFRK
jgi:hypothetical protein